MSLQCRLVSVFTSLFAASIASAQTGHFAVKYGGQKIGSADVSIKLGANGTLTEDLAENINVPRNGPHVRVSLEQVWAKSEKPISISKTEQQGTTTTRMRLDFGPTSAKMVSHTGQQSSSKDLKYPRGANLVDHADFWFVRTHPKVGATDEYTTFDPESLSWKSEKATYIGDETLTYKGHKVKAHKLTTSDGSQWLDDHGVPYKLEGTEGLELVRL